MSAGYRVAKENWYRSGGLADPRNYRLMRGGRWIYYRVAP